MRTDRSFMISITQICNKVKNCSKNEKIKFQNDLIKKVLAAERK